MTVGLGSSLTARVWYTNPVRFFIGLPIIIAGFLMVWKSEWLINNVGRVAWAEEHLGTEGGTRILYKVLGILLIFGGFFAMTGLLQDIVTGVFGPLFGFRAADTELQP